MSKVKTAFFCSNCGYESTKWLGKCPSCGTWNTFVQEVIHKESSQKRIPGKTFMKTRKRSKQLPCMK
ncbi:hypothetical protein [Paraflavitalea speifideaquila]|uniref:hypothetical protein n=1 Tax=Paraflavitalea speifideaquila TaxID=3076558 RepID=UPI0028E2F54A|nr:hypothetical protein [Paraflavitalea speifideiaquila]